MSIRVKNKKLHLGKGKVRLKAHPFRRRLIESRQRAVIQENLILSSGINIQELIKSGKASFLEVDRNGVVNVDYSNPTHLRWLED